MVGGVGNGWGRALTVLTFERLTVGFGSESVGSPARLAETMASDEAARMDADARRRLGEVTTELLAVRFNGYRALIMLARGQIPGPEAGLVNAAIAATDLGAHVVGPEALDLWPVATEAGWPGLLVGEDEGGAGLGAFDALLVAEECGRVLASVPILGQLPPSAILDAAGDRSLAAVASGELRPVYVPARPPADHEPCWTVEAAAGLARRGAPTAVVDGDSVTVDGEVAFVSDAPGAGLLGAVGTLAASGEPVAVAIEAAAEGVSLTPVMRYDPTRSQAQLTLSRARGRRLDVGPEPLAEAWYLAQALIAAESIGASQTCLDVSVAYAKERFTFGRAIGSYQAVKHELTDVLRRLENARGLQYYAGWARECAPEEFPLAASAARAAAGGALDFAAWAMINVPGGIGATWEHDAPLFFRRAQLSRRLLGGTHDAIDRVAERTLAGV